VKIICYKPSQSCKTVGELKKMLEVFPDDMPLKPSSHDKKKPVVIRFELEEGNPSNKWITLTGGGQW
jgi:hypothetical protein